LHVTLYYLISSIHSRESIERRKDRKKWTYSGEYVVESYLGYKTAVGVLLGLDLDDGYLDSGVGSYDVVGDCSSLVQDRVFRGV